MPRSSKNPTPPAETLDSEALAAEALDSEALDSEALAADPVKEALGYRAGAIRGAAEQLAEGAACAAEQLPTETRADEDARARAVAFAEGFAAFFLAALDLDGPLARFVRSLGAAELPAERFERLRLTFVRTSRFPIRDTAGYAVPPGHTLHRCYFTGRRFTLPPGAFLPVLEVDATDPETGGPAETTDEPLAFPLHPRFLQEGPEAFAAAAWEAVRALATETFDELTRVAELVQVLAALDVETLPPWPERLFAEQHFVPPPHGLALPGTWKWEPFGYADAVLA